MNQRDKLIDGFANDLDNITLKILPSPFVKEERFIVKAREFYDKHDRVQGVHYKHYIDHWTTGTIITPFGVNTIRALSSKAKDYALHIAISINWNTNSFYLNADYVSFLLDISKRTLNDLTIELIKYDIVRRTDRHNLFVINHYMFFKGEVADFISEYNKYYSDYEPEIDGKGRIKVISRSKAIPKDDIRNSCEED